MRVSAALFVVLASSPEMGAHPYTYANDVFGIAIDLPPDWQITTHKRSRISPELRDIYQLHDADVPTRPEVGKTLFSARKERAPYVDAEVRISCFMADKGDIFARVLERKESIRAKQAESPDATKYWAAAIRKLETGEWELDGLRFRFIDEVVGSRSKVTHRFAFLHVPGRGWIELHVMGKDQKNFDEALKIAGTLRRSRDSESNVP